MRIWSSCCSEMVQVLWPVRRTARPPCITLRASDTLMCARCFAPLAGQCQTPRMSAAKRPLIGRRATVDTTSSTCYRKITPTLEWMMSPHGRGLSWHLSSTLGCFAGALGLQERWHERRPKRRPLPWLLSLLPRPRKQPSERGGHLYVRRRNRWHLYVRRRSRWVATLRQDDEGLE